jgi:hypothetical protein
VTKERVWVFIAVVDRVEKGKETIWPGGEKPMGNGNLYLGAPLRADVMRMLKECEQFIDWRGKKRKEIGFV